MIAEKICAEAFYAGEIPAIKLTAPELFDINKIFDCGQCFRFDRVEGSHHQVEYAGVAHGKYVSFASDLSTLYIYNSTIEEYEKTWRHYLSLDTDYEEINREILSLSKNKSLAEAVKMSSGIRILRQDSWEALCSFIISQNNNIPRIKKLVSALCYATHGNENLSLGMNSHIAQAHAENLGCFAAFPTPDEVLSLGIDGLRELKMGFRAKYIYDAAQKVAQGKIDLDFIKEIDSTATASDMLCAISGVGPKVAACTLLFGFSRLDAFPVDVWIKRAIDKYFDVGFEPSSLGAYAGIAQQYLFYYERYLN